MTADAWDAELTAIRSRMRDLAAGVAFPPAAVPEALLAVIAAAGRRMQQRHVARRNRRI